MKSEKFATAMKRKGFLATLVLLCIVALSACRSNTEKSAEVSATDDSSQFVTLTDAVPDAILEIRYYGTYNFVGARIDGYLEPTALLTRVAADSLRAVSDDVISQGYRLKIYDAYRPQMGVDHFVRWAENVSDTLMKAFFYPDLDKSVLSSTRVCSSSRSISTRRVGIRVALPLT